jgi:hypothetical protein
MELKVQMAPDMGDAAWRALLDRHDPEFLSVVADYRGR